MHYNGGSLNRQGLTDFFWVSRELERATSRTIELLKSLKQVSQGADYNKAKVLEQGKRR